MGVHYDILYWSMHPLRTTIVPRFVSLLQSSGLLVADCLEVVVIETRGVNIHPAFAASSPNGARTFAETTQRQVDGLWFYGHQFDKDLPLMLRRQVKVRRMDVEASGSLAAQVSDLSRCSSSVASRNSVRRLPAVPPVAIKEGIGLYATLKIPPMFKK